MAPQQSTSQGPNTEELLMFSVLAGGGGRGNALLAGALLASAYGENDCIVTPIRLQLHEPSLIAAACKL